MGRISRRNLVANNTTNHVTWRSHNGTVIFDEEAAAYFLDLLAQYKDQYGIRIHSFCLMGTHPHVVCTSTLGQPAFSSFWKVVNHRLAVYVNERTNRCGQVVRDRMRSPTIQPGGRHMLTVMRYVDLNPVRAKLCDGPSHWQFSSFRHYAYGERHPLIDDAPDYLALAESPAKRRLAYQSFFSSPQQDVMLQRRPDLVMKPFIGSSEWVNNQRASAGLRAEPAAPDD